ncbi:hypothetical protein POKO110462_03240 [Pontibacter korlensis]|uniref:Uncharacterized protein n=1 Tax=Pontibacter korlensis TaxID=400092 RepID=A0A0E3UX23_9BACT|nr:hypothetical protein [Pontibacter korlensis]AKD03872.1 hypothetical protein PKOR_13055 [Pontibacter korlensis]
MRNSPSLQQLNNSQQIYNVGYTIIEYLVHKWGKQKLAEFIRSYANFEKILGVSEEGWHQLVADNY